jgi:hypothetical protein
MIQLVDIKFKFSFTLLLRAGTLIQLLVLFEVQLRPEREKYSSDGAISETGRMHTSC